AVLITLAEYGLWAALTPAVFALARRLPLEREAWIRRLALHLALAIGVAALVELVSHAVLPSLLFPEEAFGRRGPPRISLVLVLLRLRFLDELVIYLAVLAAGFARDYFLRYRERQAEAARLQAEA